MIDLFTIEPDSSQNILPKDGTVNYYGKLMSFDQANFFLENLLKAKSGLVW